MMKQIRQWLEAEREWEKQKLQSLMWKLEQLKCSQNLMARAILWCGVRCFGLVVTYCPPEKGGDVRAMHLAVTEEDFNSSCRAHVENLDSSYEKKKGLAFE